MVSRKEWRSGARMARIAARTPGGERRTIFGDTLLTPGSFAGSRATSSTRP
jgi:hypothetical protein